MLPPWVNCSAAASSLVGILRYVKAKGLSPVHLLEYACSSRLTLPGDFLSYTDCIRAAGATTSCIVVCLDWFRDLWSLLTFCRPLFGVTSLSEALQRMAKADTCPLSL